MKDKNNTSWQTTDKTTSDSYAIKKKTSSDEDFVEANSSPEDRRRNLQMKRLRENDELKSRCKKTRNRTQR